MNSDTRGYVSNNEEWPTTDAGKFHVCQRNVGYHENDGRWTVEQVAELYWSTIGVLRKRRPGAFLGVYDTHAEAMAVVGSATLQPINDMMVL